MHLGYFFGISNFSFLHLCLTSRIAAMDNPSVKRLGHGGTAHVSHYDGCLMLVGVVTHKLGSYFRTNFLNQGVDY